MTRSVSEGYVACDACQSMEQAYPGDAQLWWVHRSRLRRAAGGTKTVERTHGPLIDHVIGRLDKRPAVTGHIFIFIIRLGLDGHGSCEISSATHFNKVSVFKFKLGRSRSPSCSLHCINVDVQLVVMNLRVEAHV